MEQIKPYLEKVSFILDHVEKVILVAVLGYLAYVSWSQLGSLKEMRAQQVKLRPTEKKNVAGGEMVEAKDITAFNDALSAALNNDEAPSLKVGEGRFDHMIFYPDLWMHNESQDIFRADDGPNRQMGVKALSMKGPPVTYYLQFRPEIRIDNVRNADGTVEQRIRDRYISVRDMTIRYQTTNEVLFKDVSLHAFLPSTNVVLYNTNKIGQVQLLPVRHLPMSFVQSRGQRPFTQQAGFTNRLRIEPYRFTVQVTQADDRIIHIFKHIKPDIFGPRFLDPRRDPYSHPERIIIKYNSETVINNKRWVDMELHLHPVYNVREYKGRNRLPVYELRPGEPPNSNLGWNNPYYQRIPRFQYVDLVYDTPGKTITFTGCQVGRKLYIEGQVWRVTDIKADHVKLEIAPEHAPIGAKMERWTVYPVGARPAAATLGP